VGVATEKNVAASVEKRDLGTGRKAKSGETLAPMKTINRILVGLLSSLLLSAGLLRAAEKLDPLAQQSALLKGPNLPPSAGCTLPCQYAAPLADDLSAKVR
jgi:hypothetical protein